MSRFLYTAVAADGTKVKDELDAISESLARDELLGRNLEVQKIKRARKSIRRNQRRIGMGSRVDSCRNRWGKS